MLDLEGSVDVLVTKLTFARRKIHMKVSSTK